KQENLDDTYYRLDLKGIVRRVSRSVERLTGYPVREVVGRPASALHEDPGREMRMMEAMKSNGGSISACRLPDRAQTAAHLDFHQRPLYPRRQRRDYRHRRHVPGRQRAQGRRGRQCASCPARCMQSADAVMITDDPDGVIEYVNPSFRRRRRATHCDEVVNSTPRILKSGEHEQAYYEKLWSTVSGGNVFRDVMINKRKDGSLYYEDKTITPLMDDKGNVTHLVSTGKDISEQMHDPGAARSISPTTTP
ncbi:MAG: PAS domain-containing protein, partial [Woeseiaceae bacterium]|nr:PAS domain-containing protein [Woeseiaceae bacterium]